MINSMYGSLTNAKIIETKNMKIPKTETAFVAKICVCFHKNSVLQENFEQNPNGDLYGTNLIFCAITKIIVASGMNTVTASGMSESEPVAKDFSVQK